ncbi:ABC transporter G family member 25 (OsABCG25) (Putative white-brown complex homolog protein 26) (OsWBC26) [Durusdinium trenchii]|uniref:ABC transporter G family member 25 (OsABCG25) (Putative white-brown complex homolog protein 26) (OsWBC26) n=1 Tax=Durusdinium trenchii TaxID=1381693 RepID=A0ABP0MP59_9DINO
MSDPVVLSRRNRSFASVYGNLQRVAFEQQPPGFCRQLQILTKRSFIQWWRGSWQRAIFLGVITGSSTIMALMDTFVVKEAEWQALPILNLHTTLALLIAVFALNLFSTDRPVFWRERESGLSVAAFFVAKVFVNSIDLVLQCFLLTSVYFLIRQPVVSFLVFFPPFLLVTAAASGLGYMISTTFPPKHGPFITAIVIFVSCGLLGHPLRVETMADGGALELVVDVLSITRWTVGYYYLNFLADTDLSLFRSDPVAMEMIGGIETIYTNPSLVPAEMLGVSASIIFCISMGLLWHLVAFLRLMFSNRNRGHRHADPWKQRFYRLGGWLDDLSFRVLGEERQVLVDQKEKP